MAANFARSLPSDKRRAGRADPLKHAVSARMNPRMVRAILFDLDGTLVDTERENAESIAVVLGARGRPMSDEERRFVVGHGWREIYEHLVAGGGVDLSFEQLKEAAAI